MKRPIELSKIFTNNATDKQIWLFPWHAKQDNKAITKKEISSKMSLRVII